MMRYLPDIFGAIAIISLLSGVTYVVSQWRDAEAALIVEKAKVSTLEFDLEVAKNNATVAEAAMIELRIERAEIAADFEAYRNGDCDATNPACAVRHINDVLRGDSDD